MIAASLKNAEGDPMLDLLLRKGADATVTSNSGQVIPTLQTFPLSISIYIQIREITHGSSNLMKPPQNSLHFAASKGNLSTIRTLLSHKCSARVKDKRGQLPLHRAAAIGSTAIIKELLEKGKSPVNASDMDGLTALHQAIAEGHGDAAIMLLKAGAEPDKRDADGHLAIDLAPDGKVTPPYLLLVG